LTRLVPAGSILEYIRTDLSGLSLKRKETVTGLSPEKKGDAKGKDFQGFMVPKAGIEPARGVNPTGF